MPNELWATNDIADEQYRNSLEYGMAVNTDRALPNAFDGLKPVAKRILYDMWDTGTSSNKPHKKSARVVGDTMGKFHPHGQDAIYGAAVRLSQDWTLRYPLIDGHGNFGNIDGDPPAAMRYSEIRLTKLAEDGLLSNLKKQNVVFGENYDETEKEPLSLPSIFPNLLCNPNEGIGWAMGCHWGCHNLNEVAKIIFNYIDGIMPTYLAPDFPTGGTVLVKPGDIENIVKTGRGSVKIRGNYIIDGQDIIFTELPYGTHTETLMAEIGQNCENGNITDVVDIRNESNKNGLRLVIEVVKGGNINNVVKKLFEKTDLQTSFSYNQMALVDKTPTELNLKDCCEIYVNYNIKCIVREAQFDLDKISTRVHIVQGLLKALEDIDNVIALIKKSSNGKEAKDNLIKKYSFSEEQAKAILAMKLSSLANLEKIELQNEYQDLLKEEERLKALANEVENQKKELKARLQKIVDNYGDARRTKIIQIEEEPKAKTENAALPPQKCVITASVSGAIKCVPATSYKPQKKSEKDTIRSVIFTTTDDALLVFTNKCKVYRLSIEKMPEAATISSLFQLEANEEPLVICPATTSAKYVLFITKNGLVKKVKMEECIPATRKIIVTKLREDDELIAVHLIDEEDIILITANGMGIRFSSKDLNVASRTSTGVKGITLGAGDSVVSALLTGTMLNQMAVFDVNGRGKRLHVSDFERQQKGGKGTICSKEKVAFAIAVAPDDNVLVVGNKKTLTIAAKDIPITEKKTLGNSILKNDRIIKANRV